MPLKLTITSYQRLSPGQETTKVLDRGSLSIGRASQNDWVLQDPERILSKSHCTVHYRDGAYFLTDLSVNGTFLNDSEQRIARDQTVRINDGDHFILGEYEIAVTLMPEVADLAETALEEPKTAIVPTPDSNWPAAAQPHPADARKSPGLDISLDIVKPPFEDIFAEGPGRKHGAGAAVPGAAATAPPPDLSRPEGLSFEPPSLVSIAIRPKPVPTPAPTAESDWMEPERPVDLPAPAPTAESDWMEPERPVDLPAPAAAPVTAEQLLAGDVESPVEPLIPDDWWMAPPPSPTPASVAPTPAVRAPEKSPTPPPEPPARPTPTPTPTPTRLPERLETPAPAPRPAPTTGVDALLRAFCEGAGLPQLKLTEDQLPEVMSNLGAILRETVQGLMEILLARSDVKGEFRLDRTTMGPVENNPLKTPPGRPPLSPEEVVVLLLIKQKDAYMSPVQAVREGFNDIKAHQLAVVAGIQAALSRLLERFDPSNLEAHLEQSVLDNLWPANRKAKYWDLFTAEYQAIAREAEDDFKELFGDEFARAYEKRLRAH